jgi:DNA-binding NarL/FixJ family response regulator
VRGILDGADGMEVIGECADGNQALAAAAVLHPDVVLMDVVMPVLSGIDAARALATGLPNVKVVMLTAFLARDTVVRAVDAGAVGFLVKGDPDGLVAAVRAVASGGTAWPCSVGGTVSVGADSLELTPARPRRR